MHRSFALQQRYFDITLLKMRKSITDDNCSILEVNFEYPQINNNDSVFSGKFNSFYSNINKNYLKHCEKKLVPRIKHHRNKQKESFKSYGEIMKSYITFNSERFVSVVTDIKHFNGYFTECTRFSCVWDVENSIVLPYTYFFEKAKITLRTARKEIFKKIVKELENGECEFSYTEENIKRYALKFNPKNYFITDRGIAFWYEPGTLAPENEGFPTYIIEC